MYILILLISLYILFLFLSSKGEAVQWLRGKTASLQNKATQVVADEAGQGLVEYALILVLVAVVVIAILTVLGPQIGHVFSDVACTLNSGPIIVLPDGTIIQ
jgi:pilus assembly protein Flp/PilA